MQRLEATTDIMSARREENESSDQRTESSPKTETIEKKWKEIDENS